MSSTRKRFAIVAMSTGLVAAAGTAVAAADSGPSGPGASAPHVLLLSVDGLHQQDLDWYAAHKPDSALARLVHQGRSYTDAQTPFPSDSFPGMVGQVTGGNPQSTGI